MSSQEPVPVTGIWLRRHGDDVEVLAEIDGKWKLLIVEGVDGQFSHIVEPLGMRRAKNDPLVEEGKP